VVHLAGIVGFPACRKDPNLSNLVNVMGSETVAGNLDGRLSVFASTGSVYGDLSEVLCTEETEPKPISLYSQNKVQAEKFFLAEEGIVLRFATGFGASPRMRLDLMVNDFTNQALRLKYLVLYEGHFMRTFIHVTDMARAIIFALEHPEKMSEEVYNVGSQSMDWTKLKLCELIRQKTGCYLHCADVDADPDKRNCLISYDKIEAAGFKTAVSIEQGVDELIRANPLLEFRSVYSNV
jgi:nucleoside-diphosphate-sugar epimerase